MTQQQHLNHSPQKEEFKAINTARQLNNATGGCKLCRGCKTRHRGSLGVITCLLLGTTSPCAQRQWEGKTVPAAACLPSLAAPFPASQPHTGVSGSPEASKHQTRSPTPEQNRGQEICPRAGFSTACQVPLIQGFY